MKQKSHFTTIESSTDSIGMNLILTIAGSGLLFVLVDLFSLFCKRWGYYLGFVLLVASCVLAFRRYIIILENTDN